MFLMGFCQKFTLPSGRRLVFVVILTIFAYSSATRCNNNKGICVKREQCKYGNIKTGGEEIIVPRMHRRDFEECDAYGTVCCLPADVEPDSNESFTGVSSTIEEPDDTDWSRQCGQRKNVSEIADQDNETNRFEFPWNVALFSVTKIAGRRRKEFLCGGTLIHDYVVLTAARCVHQQIRESLSVELGRWDLNAPQESRTQEIAVEQLIVHREYVPSSYVNNIALLILADGASLGPAVNRVCLADDSMNFDGSLCYVVGWSNSPKHNIHNRQLKLRSSFATAQQCTNSIQRATGSLEFKLPGGRRNICPEYLDQTVQCERAPGSGLVCESGLGGEGQYFLVGIASYSVRNCAQYQVHDVFVNIPDYIEWIDDGVKNHSFQTSFYRPDPSGFE